MRYEIVFHPDHADPPFTLWLIEVEGPNPELALRRNLGEVIASARSTAREYFGADIFTPKQLKDQIHVIGESRWLAAKDL